MEWCYECGALHGLPVCERDAIAKLEAEVEQLNADLDHENRAHVVTHERWMEATDEIDRLREAVRVARMHISEGRYDDGCTGGDYWKQGEGQFECPKCGHVNRLYDRPDVVELKRYFASVEDVYDR